MKRYPVERYSRLDLFIIVVRLREEIVIYFFSRQLGAFGT